MSETLKVADTTNWQLVVAVAHDGYRIQNVHRTVLDHIADGVWKLQDGYGEPGFTPPQGWDWSGIRDSSPKAKFKMGVFVRTQLNNVGITSIELEDAETALRRFSNG